MKHLLFLYCGIFLSLSVHAQTNDHYHLSREYGNKGLYKKAIEVLDLAIAEDEPYATYYLDKARYQAANRDLTHAEQTMDIGIRLMPDSIELYLMRAGYYAAILHEEGAIKDFETAFTLTEDPDKQVNILASIAGLKTQIRKFDEAYIDLERALAIDSTNLNLLINLAAVCDNIGRSDDAFMYLERVIEIQPEYHGAYINLGFQYQGIGNHSKALTYFDKAIDIAPDEPLAYSNRSYSRLVTNDLEGAMKDVNLSLKMLPNNSWAFKIRALIHLENGETKKACTDLQTAKSLGYAKRYGEEVNFLINKHCGERS